LLELRVRVRLIRALGRENPMIHHVSVGVRDLEASRAFYGKVLEALGMKEIRVRENTVGFGKQFPEFWLNRRPGLQRLQVDTGDHICLAARTVDAVKAFHSAGLAMGGTDEGPPGLRPEYTPNYYAAFLSDPDGNKIEAVCFLEED
jgi:catechol 2,3-dioxygenase-like lactoylglutathione lyase family enzyme